VTEPGAKPIAVETLVAGEAAAPVFVILQPLSFWGGLDTATGGIIDRRHPQVGKSVAGRILLMEAGRGSSSGSSVLAEAIRLGTAPAGIVLLTRDAIVTVGAMVGVELYQKPCPVVLACREEWSRITGARSVRISADLARGEIVALA
jgi:predicted aconitase with swiveling domain